MPPWPGERTARWRSWPLNYLLGARILTYGFTPEGDGAFNEGLMKQLASDNWGWYRRLN